LIKLNRAHRQPLQHIPTSLLVGQRSGCFQSTLLRYERLTHDLADDFLGQVGEHHQVSRAQQTERHG
jgi:hypothetical protein